MPRGEKKVKSHNEVMAEMAAEVDGRLRYNEAGRQCLVKTVNGQTYWVDYYPKRQFPYHLSIRGRDNNWRQYNYKSRKTCLGAITNGRRIR